MSLKDKLGSTLKQATNYLGNVNIKDKVIEMKDKTIDKVKGIDNPDHYTAPAGFELFKIPVAISTAEITRTLDKVEPFHLKEKDKIIDAYVRLLSLLGQDETIINAITATMKKTYLIVCIYSFFLPVPWSNGSATMAIWTGCVRPDLVKILGLRLSLKADSTQ